MHTALDTATKVWLNLLDDLLTTGDNIAPRGIETRELLFKSATFNMNSPIIYHQERKLNYAFSAAEAYFIAHGDNRVANLIGYNPHIAAFSDDGLIYNGAYGPPFNDQVMYVVNTLREDLSSRRAVLTIWKQNPVETKDYMCTIALQFLVRNDQMYTKVTMRSSDAWLGIPYDWFNFTIMTLRILTLLNKGRTHPITLGQMNWSAGSFHLYERDVEKVKQVLAAQPNKAPQVVPFQAYDDWPFVVESLQACMKKQVNTDLWIIRP